MRRPLVALVACLLLTATGLGLLGVAATVAPAPVVVVATATAEPTAVAAPRGAESQEPEPLAAPVTVPLPCGPVLLRVVRHALAPGVVLPPVRTKAPTALIVELGAVGVQTYDAFLDKHGLGEFQTDTVLRRGKQVVVDAGTIRDVRNAGRTPAVVLVVAIEPVAVAHDRSGSVNPAAEPVRAITCGAAGGNWLMARPPSTIAAAAWAPTAVARRQAAGSRERAPGVGLLPDA
jgi:hypothetical protein